MHNRRQGQTHFWESFWKNIYGERRKEKNMNKVFVFGSNLKGVHGAGAAQFALEQRGAIWGQGIGLQGNSYGIPTKDREIQTLPLEAIALHVRVFINFAKMNPDMKFEVTRIGCGLAGYTPADIAPLFKGVPDNCDMPEDFKPYLKG